MTLHMHTQDLTPRARRAAELEEFARRTAGSRAAHTRVDSLIPGGAPGGLLCFPPDGGPIHLERGAGAYVWDADGNRCLDFVAGDWTMILGHGNAEVDCAIVDRLSRGTTLCAPDPDLGFELATLLHERYPSMERMRFTTSGTEAVLFAMRVARAATGRPKIAKMRGAYHGTYDTALVANGKFADPAYVVPGLMPGTVQATVLLEYNDIPQSLATIEQHRDELAAVIVEPVHATTGMVPADAAYLQALREVTARFGIILIFDEVCCLGVSAHGAQGTYGVTPDLTTLGKAVGGGLPLGVFGGSAAVMRQVDPWLNRLPGETSQNTAPVRHASTLAGTALNLTVALATVRQLTPELHAHLDDLGSRLRSGINAVGARHGLPLRATGAGNLFGLHWTPHPVVDIRTAQTSRRRVVHELNVFLYNAGYLVMPNGNGIVTAAMTVADIDGFLDDLDRIAAGAGPDGWDAENEDE